MAAALVLASFARQPEHYAARGALTSRHPQHRRHGNAPGRTSSLVAERERRAAEQRKLSSERRRLSERERKPERQQTIKFIPGTAALPQQPEHATLKVIAAGQSTTSTHWLQDTLCFYGMKTWHDHMICDPKPAHKGKRLDATAKRIEAKNQMRDFKDIETTEDLRLKLDRFVKYVQQERVSAIADFPVFYFFDELRTTFPRASVLLTARNATTWASARKLKNNLVCREAVIGSPMEAASAQMSPKLPHPFALLPCLERQLLRGEDSSLAFMHMSDLQTNATGLAKLVAAFDAYNAHVRDSSDATKTPFVEIDVANPGSKEGDERVKNAALVKIAEILDPKVKELVKESLPSSGLNISELSDAMFGNVRPFDATALVSNASLSSVAPGAVALKAAEALKADESNTSWFAALDSEIKANVTAEREAAAAKTNFAARQQPVNAAIQPAAAANLTASADATVQEELVAQLRTGKALHAAERAAGEALAQRAEAAVAAAERLAQKALEAKTSALRNSSEAADLAHAAAEEATAAAEVAAAERAVAELKGVIGKATSDEQSSATQAEEKAAQSQLVAGKAAAEAEESAAEAAAKTDLENAAADKVAEELAKKAETAEAAARAVQDAAAAVQNATEQKLSAIMSGAAASEEKEAAERGVREAMAAAPERTLKVIAAGQSTTSTTWMQDTLCAFGLKTWHDHMMCVPEDATSSSDAGGGLGHVPYHAGEPMKRFGAFARKMAAHHRMEDVADIGSADQLSSVLSRFKEFVVGERLAAVADFPVFYFFDELHEAFPEAAILLSVRNSTDWASARRMKNNLLCREAVSDERSPLAEKLEPALPHPFALLPCLARHLILGGRPKAAFVHADELQNNATGLAKLAAAFDAYNAHVREVAQRSNTRFAEMDVVNGLETDGLVKVAELLTGAPPAAEELASLTAGALDAPVQLARSAESMAAEYAKNQTLPVAVICAEVGNSRHTAEFVEYHKSLGFSRVYAYDSGLTDESREVLKSFAPETVTLLTGPPDVSLLEKPAGVDECIKRISADYGIEGPDTARQHVWVFTLESDEFVSPFALGNSVPQLLASYEARGALHLHLEKVWFGGGWNKNVEECRAGPLLARFVRYGTQEQSRDGSGMHLAGARSAGVKIGKPAFSTRVLPPMHRLQAAYEVAPRLHLDQTLLQTSVVADVEGAHGLVLHHFKPQSLEEYRDAAEFKQSQQKLRQRHPKKQSKREEEKEARREAAQLEAQHAWVNRTWEWSHNHTNGATHASMLLRIPAICRSYPRFADSLRECGLEDLCNDCEQLQERHGCTREAEKPLQPVSGASAAAVALHRMPTVDVIGSGAALVVSALAAAGVSAQSVDVSQLTQVAAEGVRVQTDPEDREAVCAALCEHTLIVDPRLVADEKTIVSMIRAWTGSSHWPHPFY